MKILCVIFVAVVVCLSSIRSAPSLYEENVSTISLPTCPDDSEVLLDPHGRPRKCLPHQTNLCLSHINTEELDAESVCCWFNQVDYFCCLDVSADICPPYSNVTVVIHKKHFEPQAPSTYYFPNNQVRHSGGYGAARSHRRLRRR